jgi:prepilin-type N-terminal cleavage/methylation domain-containing protein
MQKHARLSPAFSMIELVFAIVILGIVSSIGAEIIAKVYQSYILQRAEYRATIQTELAATQIANRLAAAIPGTIYRIKNDNSFESIDSALSGNSDDYIGLQWVGSDEDSFSASQTPGWSGFCDLNTSTQSSISTPGSNLAVANTIQTNLGKSGSTFSIYFPYDTTAYLGSGTSNTIALDSNISHMVEHYKLAWSSYALIVENGDLYLYYNFAATPKATRSSTTKSLLMKNISTFKFKGAGKTIRFKICKEEDIGEDFNVTACKEKVVF